MKIPYGNLFCNLIDVVKDTEQILYKEGVFFLKTVDKSLSWHFKLLVSAKNEPIIEM